jgi:hypothetical protein
VIVVDWRRRKELCRSPELARASAAMPPPLQCRHISFSVHFYNRVLHHAFSLSVPAFGRFGFISFREWRSIVLTISYSEAMGEDAGVATNGVGLSTHDSQARPKTGIKVIIVGAGFGGLCAAIECHRSGHDVEIYESCEYSVGQHT